MTTPTPPSVPLTHSLLNVLLVLIESILALVLRLDGKLRRSAYPLVKNETVVLVRTYLPHTQIYATFTQKGVLLDTRLPRGREADVTINAYTHELFMVLVGHNTDKIDALQMRGERGTVNDVRQFLAELGLGGVLGSLLGKFKKPDDTADKSAQKTEKLAELKEKLHQKTLECEQLFSDNKRLSTELAEAQGKQNALKIALIIVSVVAIFAIVANFIW